MRLLFALRALVLFHSISNTVPVDVPSVSLFHSSTQYQRSSEARSRRGLKIVKTTEYADGTILDWVVKSSQVLDATIASPPPLPAQIPFNTSQAAAQPSSILQEISAETGPEGTVPIPRLNTGSSGRQGLKKLPPADPGHSNPSLAERAMGDHYYASTAQIVNNLGGRAVFNLWKAYTELWGDFSLLQTAVTRLNVPKPGNNSVLVTQTVEAGWINYPGQIFQPHLFTYFTTDGHVSNADKKGGWNREVDGWVQFDSEIFPGTIFSPLSTPGGTQYEMQIRYLLFEGNWWLFVLDRWIGYYPATLFSADTNPNQNLAVGSNCIYFYGEIYDSHQDHVTTTDMGSGRFANAGFAQAAYMRNIAYTNTLNADQPYNATPSRSVVTDTNRYTTDGHYQNIDNWGSYMYLGGPGAGGVVGG